MLNPVGVGFKQTRPYLLLARIQPRKQNRNGARRFSCTYKLMMWKKLRRDADIHPWPKN
jgi:hypothetical protein